MASFTTQASYNVRECPSKMDEIYAWFDANGQLSETAALDYSGDFAILTIVNCTGSPPPPVECADASTQTT